MAEAMKDNTMAGPGPGRPPKKKDALHRYAIVKIAGKLDAKDADLVIVNVNGDRRTFKRNSLVVMTLAHVEALRHATRPMAKPGELSDINPYTEYGSMEVEDAPRFGFEVRGEIDDTTYNQCRKIHLAKDKGGEGRAMTEQEVVSMLGR